VPRSIDRRARLGGERFVVGRGREEGAPERVDKALSAGVELGRRSEAPCRTRIATSTAGWVRGCWQGLKSGRTFIGLYPYAYPYRLVTW
jgi:hypothetical protein